MWRATLKGLLAHRFRLILTAVSVVLGVAFVAGTYVLTDTIGNAFNQLVTESTEGVDVIVRADAPFEEQFGGPGGGGERIPEGLLGAIRGVDGVASADGSVFGYAQFLGKDGEP
ncbi:MAG: ABC transporter permease, partial [Actinobacteria bacterium]|nr:ABC transporter permease [Actinomycetota bacterium]